MALQGVRELVDQITLMEGAISTKAAKAGVNAALAVLVKSIKSGVNASGMSLDEKAAARATVNKRLKKKEGDETGGKAGFGVGKQSAAKKRKATARRGRGQGGTGEERGVGISSANVHWLMGTQDRTTQSGHATGKMPDVLSGIIATAAEDCTDEMLAAAAAKIRQVLAKEAAKK